MHVRRVNQRASVVKCRSPATRRPGDGGLREFERELCRRLADLGVQGTRLAIGVSGGADSIALLRGLLAVREECALELTVAHVDHGLRADSADDAAWVATLCAALQVHCETRRTDVATRAANTGGGIEDTARRERYRLLAEIALSRGCPFLAVGHTADDQAETILHRLLRGTGLDGLRGMPAVRDVGPGVRLIRPLLTNRREKVQSYLREIGQEFREDRSNTDPKFTRNRIRRSLLPLLREQFNPRVEEALLRLGAQAGECQALIGSLAEDLLDEMLLDVQPDHVRVDCGKAAHAPRPLLREVFKRLWERQDWPRGAMSFPHWDQLASQAGEREGVSPPRITLPGPIDIHRRGDLLTIARRI